MGQQFDSRADLIRFLENKVIDMKKKTIELTRIAGGGHVGGALSMMDVVVALHYHIMKLDSKKPRWEERDRFVLSKGHGGIGLCPVLCDLGFFPEEDMANFNQLDSPFGIHPDMHKIPGIEMSTGSLGHGLSVAVGMGLGRRLDNAEWRVFCLLGDGECNEGTVWEAAMAAAHYKLGCLTAIVDRNMMCIDGPTESVMSLEPFADKWRAFGWNTVEIDGHNMSEIVDTFENMPPPTSDKPNAVIAKTVKGKGISFMENEPAWHYGGIDDEKAEICDRDLEAARPERSG
jgi:transketolase